MGQEQSSDARKVAEVVARGDGVQLVQGSGRALVPSSEKDEVQRLLEQSASLKLPQQLLPPAGVEHSTYTRQGVYVMHELRTAIGGLLGMEHPGLESKQPQHSSSATHEEVHTEEIASKDAHANDDTVVDVNADADTISGNEGEKEGNVDRRASSIHDIIIGSNEDIQAEQEKWERLGIDPNVVHAVVHECTGGKRMEHILNRQDKLMKQIEILKHKSFRLTKAMDANKEQAKRTTKALGKLDRIHVCFADVQDTLESAVATANILGASHFAHDDEMCSFKKFLEHNPPIVP